MNLDDLRASIDAALARALPDDAAPPLIIEAMRYALLGGGKRFRPCLTLAVAEAIALRDGGSPDEARALALPGACAVELVHTYSLVHDDLPAMDDDQLRRGRATVHVVYGDGVAILAGDGLLTEAFSLLAEPASRLVAGGGPVLASDARLRAVEALARAAGAAGMVGGQTLDLAASGKAAAPASEGVSLEDMHARKTGAMIRAAAALGAIAASADAATGRAVDDYARHLGLAFQIVDDVLDVEGTDAELGKRAGKDAAARKLTYPALYGLDQSRQLAHECVVKAKAALCAASLSGRLPAIADWMIRRRA